MTLREDLDALFKTDARFVHTVPGEPFYDGTPVVYTRYGGTQSQGRTVIEVVILTGLVTESDPYSTTQKAIEDAIDVCEKVAFPALLPVSAIHDFRPGGGKQGYVGAVIRCVGD